MDEIIQKLKTPEECIQLAKNVRDNYPELACKARRRAIELRAVAHDNKSAVEIDLLKALYAYEEVLSEKNNRRTRASRTWQMINRHGIIGAAERAVNRKIEPTGYKVLVEMGMHDLTFEAVIVRYPEAFNQEVVARAKARLEELKKYSRMGGIESVIGPNNSINAVGDSPALHCQRRVRRLMIT